MSWPGEGKGRFCGFERSELPGWTLLQRRDARGKTFRIVLLWQLPWSADQAGRALLPRLLQHGTRTHRDRPALARARERLYGAEAGWGVSRHGETSLLRLSVDAVAGDFLPARPDQFGDAIALLADMALRPQIEDGRFAPELFARERAQLLVAARAVADDKAQYARQQAIANGCRGEPYAIPEHGGEDAIAALREGDPAARLRDFLERGRRLVLVHGALPADPAAALRPLVEALPAAASPPIPAPVVPAPREPGRTREATQAQQAKVVLLFRVPRPASLAELHALQLALSLWGGGTHSRLFREVRERRSLCYYASAAADADKGIALVHIGCDVGAVDAVVQETLAQLAALGRGEFTDDELATTLAATQGPYRSIDDSPGMLLSFTADQWLRGCDEDAAARIRGLAAVPRAAVAAAAARVRFDHEYALVPSPRAEGGS